MIMKNNKAQSLIEYGLILGIVTVALLSMQAYFKRGIQSVVKVAADDYGPQGEPVRDVEIAIKKKVYYDEGKLAVNSKGTSTWEQTRRNLGDSDIQTTILGGNTINGEEPSVLIGGDYKRRKLQETRSGPPSIK